VAGAAMPAMLTMQVAATTRRAMVFMGDSYVGCELTERHRGNRSLAAIVSKMLRRRAVSGKLSQDRLANAPAETSRS
jgi:hypothetical protein